MMPTSPPNQPATGIVLLAHGSRPAGSNRSDILQDIANDLIPPNARTVVRRAFLQRQAPNLAETVEALLGEGIRRILVLPLLLTEGNHYTRDIPAETGRLCADHPDLDIQILPPIGSHPRFKMMLREIIKDLS